MTRSERQLDLLNIGAERAQAVVNQARHFAHKLQRCTLADSHAAPMRTVSFKSVDSKTTALVVSTAAAVNKVIPNFQGPAASVAPPTLEDGETFSPMLAGKREFNLTNWDSNWWSRFAGFAIANWQIIGMIHGAVLTSAGNDISVLRNKAFDLVSLHAYGLRLFSIFRDFGSAEIFSRLSLPPGRLNFLRGSALHICLYNQNHDRLGKDIDVGIDPNDAERVDRSFKLAGLKPVIWSKTDRCFLSIDDEMFDSFRMRSAASGQAIIAQKLSYYAEKLYLRDLPPTIAELLSMHIALFDEPWHRDEEGIFLYILIEPHPYGGIGRLNEISTADPQFSSNTYTVGGYAFSIQDNRALFLDIAAKLEFHQHDRRERDILSDHFGKGMLKPKGAQSSLYHYFDLRALWGTFTEVEKAQLTKQLEQTSITPVVKRYANSLGLQFPFD